jgi:predicted PurR-regulated permease PerM
MATTETTPTAPNAGLIPPELEAQTAALRLIAAVLACGSVYFLREILVPFLAALVLAVALTPLGERLERMGLKRGLAALACMLLVAAVIGAVAALVVWQVGEILGQLDQYLDRLGETLARAVRAIGGDPLMESAEAHDVVRRNARAAGGWLVSGLGGLLGFVVGVVLMLAFLFYMLALRTDWIARIGRAATRLGLRPRHEKVDRVQAEIVTYIKCLSFVSVSYTVVISLALWALGVPRPLLWGALTGVLELIPYFGPVLAGALPTLMALGSGGAWWQPLAIVALFVALQTVEGYVVAPLLYGEAVTIDPVTVILGILFFGVLLGPMGLALAMPLMIFLRGLLAITPETPALDALMDADGEAATDPAC